MNVEWLEPLRKRIAEFPQPRGLALVLPAYRPDLNRAAADVLGLAHCDFRAEIMARAGADPATLPLSLIDDTIDAMTGPAGVVFHNIEALLAVHPRADRQAWLAGFIGRPVPASVVLPIVLFATDLPTSADVVTVPPDRVPEDSLMMRLWSTR